MENIEDYNKRQKKYQEEIEKWERQGNRTQEERIKKSKELKEKYKLEDTPLHTYL